MTQIAEAGQTEGNPLLRSLSPLIVDAGVPVATYYLLSKGFDFSVTAALAWSSVLPAARTIWGLVARRRFNALAALILAANVVSLLLSAVVGDPRLMLAKDSGVSSVIGIAVLCSAFLGRPIMTAAMKPWVTKGDPAKLAAWDRLAAASPRFRRAERTFSIVWGAALLTECVARVVGAYTLPIDTMAWLGSVFLIGAIAVAMVVGGGLAVDPMEKMVEAEAR
ncbi:VC0807 family protein [Amycolatopsis anabasis]|uniref:VC0807 family protein n=1 Tax=Amycolatopsis anabasis TaxID=1840409 RepID=UPI00131DF324|nr:VC0807 family protein [Amycolatopsis anabasis]